MSSICLFHTIDYVINACLLKKIQLRKDESFGSKECTKEMKIADCFINNTGPSSSKHC